jgi:hypothetical protein
MGEFEKYKYQKEKFIKDTAESKEIVFLQQQLTTAAANEARLRSALEQSRSYIYDTADTGKVSNEYVKRVAAVMQTIDKALSTPPSGGLSELVEAVGGICSLYDQESNCHIMAFAEKMIEAHDRLHKAYTKVIGGE